MKVKEILKSKGPEVFTISLDKTLDEAIATLTGNNIGVLMVINDQAQTAGIISERDILKAVRNNPDGFRSNKVSEYMTTNIVFAEPDDDVEYVESIMTTNRCRHLPVFSDKTLVGLISIGDVVKAQLSETRHQNKYLMDYISGGMA